MDMTNIIVSLTLSLFHILMIPQSTLSAPIMFLCNKTDPTLPGNAFLCELDIQTDHRATEWKMTLNHFTMSINAITGIMLCMLIVIFMSIIFNIVRFRSAKKSVTSTVTPHVMQPRKSLIERADAGNTAINNLYEVPIAACNGQNEDADYLELQPDENEEESLYAQLDHEKALMKQGISTIAVDNAVYAEVIVEDNVYDHLEHF
ncbi:uncharacterized protein [Chironomus tepperi]|uniref:uncharacterized protein isoform X2 n=1 Tax=Chironomus tepperi TaxID=113505 RepID=UPI00391F8117